MPGDGDVLKFDPKLIKEFTLDYLDQKNGPCNFLLLDATPTKAQWRGSYGRVSDAPTTAHWHGLYGKECNVLPVNGFNRSFEVIDGEQVLRFTKD
jgi:hypothetical protein